MDRFKKWAEHEHSQKQRMIAVVFGGIIFWIVIPFLIIVVSFYIDRWPYLSTFHYGLIDPVIGLMFIVIGWLFANWTVKVQFSVGKGTPVTAHANTKTDYSETIQLLSKPNDFRNNPFLSRNRHLAGFHFCRRVRSGLSSWNFNIH